MGDGGGFGEKYWGNVAGAGYSVRVSHTVGAVIWDQELGGDGGYAKITRRIPSSGSGKYFGDDVAVYDKQRVGVDPSG